MNQSILRGSIIVYFKILGLTYSQNINLGLLQAGRIIAVCATFLLIHQPAYYSFWAAVFSITQIVRATLLCAKYGIVGKTHRC